ncbi:hypothetical protein BD324DRAFT_659672 [Kockovaella imperatae]|uniref:Uncharacterized protein n=1 Tax=Kockovaella imperatae TaxID=4999 RepID=A0A1Y1USW4_9TREE|nr:hypothetical protein BD324DRAFT_659672 [Kockovaella imperatae]ORX41109.1 hypothetical protein BD324DRAFT_659672 [Kockovaella imperatae]
MGPTSEFRAVPGSPRCRYFSSADLLLDPPQATMGTPMNQTSMSRLVSVNSIDDFCVFAPPEPNSVIGETEAEEVAWCIQQRNDARVIPDGTFQAIHFVKSPLYVQVMGWGDFTRINIQYGDEGGELDPHGATGLGNPVGGNVTSNITGQDVHYEEWMNYMAYNQFCIRICTAENSTYSAALECQHTLDEMGCEWVMPGDYTNNSFTSCDADAAYPPGLYPLANGSTSTFAQRYTGTYTNGAGSVGTFTVGETVTPQTPYSTPASSNCVTYSTIGNGIANVAIATEASNSTSASSTMTSGTASSASMTSTSSASGKSMSSGSGSASGSAKASGASSSTTSGAAMTRYAGINQGPAVAGACSVVALVLGAAALLL